MLRLHRDLRAGKWAYFLRQETLHGLVTYLEDNPGLRSTDSDFHAMSHGESVLDLVGRRFDDAGFYVLDEPESGLAFTSCLALAIRLSDIAARGGQVLCATHLPILTAIPGATILQVGEHGVRPVSWEDLPDVGSYRAFLTAPDRFFRED